MTIERTEEMLQAALVATECDPAECHECMGKAVTAVLTLVERDYVVRPFCNDELAPGIVCKQGKHSDEAGHYAITNTGARVEWT